MSMGLETYPTLDEIVQTLKTVGAKKVIAFDATAEAVKLGDSIVTNIVMIGAIMGLDILPIPTEIVLDTVKEKIPSALLEMNLQAFDIGFDMSKKLSLEET